MSISTIWTEFKAWFSVKVVPDVEAASEAALDAAKKDAPAIALAIAEALLSVVEGKTPFAILIATIKSIGKTQGITLLDDSAIAALNAGENKLMAAGTPSAITIAASAAADTAMPLSTDHPAVVAATAAAVAIPVADAAASQNIGIYTFFRELSLQLLAEGAPKTSY